MVGRPGRLPLPPSRRTTLLDLLLPPSAAWILNPVAGPRDRRNLLRAVSTHGIGRGASLRCDRGIDRPAIRVFFTDHPLVIASRAAARFEKSLIVFTGSAAILHRIQRSNTLLHPRLDGA